jgi:Arc/MetJ-type ribon-helix-helix transcriptional regulator
MNLPDSQNVTLSARVPRQLLAEIEALVEAGWYRDLEDLVVDALRRHADSHRQALAEEFVREDVEWGLRGSD